MKRLLSILAALAARVAIPHRFVEKLQMKVAWLMPRWLVYWCSIRLIAHATTGKFGDTIVPELPAMDALKRWEVPACLLAAVVAFASIIGTVPAIAADLPAKQIAPVQKAAAVAKQYGLYLGFNGGAALTNQRFDFVSLPGTGDVYPAGGLAGLTLGFGGTAGGFWLGVEGDLDYDFTKGSAPCSAGTCFTRNSWMFAEKAIVGLPLTSIMNTVSSNSRITPPSQWAIPLAVPANLSASTIMPFVAIGMAQRNVKAGIADVGEASQWMNGVLVGGGIRQALADGWTAKIEYDYVSFRDHFNPAGGSAPIFADFKAVSEHVLTAGIGYHF